MNLYQAMTNHYAPKDSHKSIWGYVIAESNESLYEWLKLEKECGDDDIGRLFLSWTDKEDEDDDYEDFKSQMIENMDEESTDYADYSDLYYGRTFVSWKLVKEDVKPDALQQIKEYGIRLLDSRVIN